MSHFNLFTYGTLRRGGSADARLAGCEYVADGAVGGVLYDVDGRYPALLMYGDAPVHGEVWRCPAELLRQLDAYEGVAGGLFRRVGVEVAVGGGTVPCWVYTAGPALARRLQAQHRLGSDGWRID